MSHDPIADIMSIVSRISGIQLPVEKRILVETRLTRRARELGLKSKEAYLEYFKSHREEETQEIVSAITTHTTSFFREERHFEFLTRELFPLLASRQGKPIRIWSAASSTGEEALSLAICLSEFLERTTPDRTQWPKIEILGTDIDPRSVDYARNGIYSSAQAEKLPRALLSKYFDRGQGGIRDWYRARDAIHGLCSFRIHNLHDPEIAPGPWDIVFLRNALIYFSKSDIEKIVERFQSVLSPEGLFVIGHSDTFMGAQTGFKSIANSVYAMPSHPLLAKDAPKTAIAGSSIPARKPPVRVIIVDDSKSIRAVLKKIIQSDPALQVVAEAENPLEARKLLETTPVDLMTLDIHMPVMDGVTYLEQIQGKPHPPIVMISSISYEDAAESLKCLEMGAVDYIEKPRGLDLLTEQERICSVLKAASTAKRQPTRHLVAPKRPALTTTGLYFQPDDLVLIGASTGGTEALRVVLQEIPENTPPILMVQHIPPGFSAALAKRLDETCKMAVVEAVHGQEVLPGTAYLAPGAKQMKVERSRGTGKLRIAITDDPPLNRHKPSVDYLFQSVAAMATDFNVSAAILTGMGSDGAQGLAQLKTLGAHTIAQNEETCVVFGMPKVAIELGAASEVVPLPSIGYHLVKGVRLSHTRKKASAA